MAMAMDVLIYAPAVEKERVFILSFKNVTNYVWQI